MNLLNHILGVRGKGFNKTSIDPEDIFIDSSNIPTFNVHQLEGQIEKPLSSFVGSFLFFVLVFVFFFFLVKLYSMQVINHETYLAKAERNILRSTPIFARRGTISDRNDKILAWNESRGDSIEIPRREYIKEEGFSHLLGYVTYPKKDTSGVFWQDEYIGKDGVEKSYQELLAGKKGEKLIAVSALHEIEAENITIDSIDGKNLKLSIDAGVQNKLYESIKSLANKVSFKAGAGVIMDVHTGEILALVSYPEYDNNLMVNASTTADKKQISNDLLDKNNKFLNRPVGGLFTPGSTVKPFVAIAALMENIIDPYKYIYSSGALVIKNKYGGPDTVFRDWKAHGYVNMRDAIAVSSDEYFYQVGGGFKDQKGLGIAHIDEYARRFGFASSTGIDLPGESTGVIPTPEWKKKNFKEGDWLLGDTYHTSIGQYGFQLTPLELVRAVSSIANGGYLVTPHVLLDLNTESQNINLQEKDLKVIREGMRQGVQIGVAKALNIEGVKIAAKTGTAELGVDKLLVNSWISGFFPYDNPRYAFVVIMEKGSRFNLTGAVFAARETLEWMRDNTSYTK